MYVETIATDLTEVLLVDAQVAAHFKLNLIPKKAMNIEFIAFIFRSIRNNYAEQPRYKPS